MTKAPDIAGLEKSETQFADWLAQQQQNVNAARDQAVKDTSSRATAFIAKGGWKDAKPFANGAFAHVDHSAKWSMDGINKIIDDTVSSLLGGKNPPSPDPSIGGTNKVTVSPDADAAVLMLGGFEGAIALSVKGLVQSVLADVSSSINASTGSSYGTVEPVPGLVVFNAVIESSYSRQDFFNGETILQNVFVFESWFIPSRATDLANYDRAVTDLKTVATADILISKIDALLANLDPSADDYDAKYAKYQGSLKSATQNRDSAKTAAAA
jgi:hypothetical protein